MVYVHLRKQNKIYIFCFSAQVYIPDRRTKKDSEEIIKNTFALFDQCNQPQQAQ